MSAMLDERHLFGGDGGDPPALLLPWARVPRRTIDEKAHGLRARGVLGPEDRRLGVVVEFASREAARAFIARFNAAQEGDG